MVDRIGCCVPFCRRTTAKFKTEWLCEIHWRSVPMSIKRRRAKLRRIMKRTLDPLRRDEIIYLDDILWQRAKKTAIERAVGI